MTHLGPEVAGHWINCNLSALRGSLNLSICNSTPPQPAGLRVCWRHWTGLHGKTHGEKSFGLALSGATAELRDELLRMMKAVTWFVCLLLSQAIVEYGRLPPIVCWLSDLEKSNSRQQRRNESVGRISIDSWVWGALLCDCHRHFSWGRHGQAYVWMLCELRLYSQQFYSIFRYIMNFIIADMAFQSFSDMFCSAFGWYGIPLATSRPKKSDSCFLFSNHLFEGAKFMKYTNVTHA